MSFWGKHLGFYDVPNERSSHQKSTPKGGGIGILAAFFFTSIYTGINVYFLISLSGISLLSLLDDRFELSVRIRLCSQLLAALIILYSLKDSLIFQPNISNEILGKALYLATWLVLVLFIVGTANFFNFMDGINGIAAITGTIAFGMLAFVSWQESQTNSIVALCGGLSLSCLGFLPFNLPKARVFMGDVGSVLLGAAFAAIVIEISNNWTDLICFAGFIFPFYADEMLTIVGRLRGGRSLSKAHRGHIYQMLANEMGVAHWKISLGYGGLQVFIALLLLISRNIGILIVLLVLISFMGLFSITFWKLDRKEFGDDG